MTICVLVLGCVLPAKSIPRADHRTSGLHGSQPVFLEKMRSSGPSALVSVSNGVCSGSWLGVDSALTFCLTSAQGSESLPSLTHDRTREISSKRCVDGVLGRVLRALLLPRAFGSKGCRSISGRVVFSIRCNHTGLVWNGCFGSVGDWVGSCTHRSYGPRIQRHLVEIKEVSPP